MEPTTQEGKPKVLDVAGKVEEVEVEPGKKEEVLKVELPPDLLPPAEKPEGEEEEKEEETVKGKPEGEEEEPDEKPAGDGKGKKVVPLEALQKERGKRKAATTAYERAEQDRQNYEAEVNRLREADRQRQEKEEPAPNYNEEPDLNAAMGKLEERLTKRYDADRRKLSDQMLIKVVTLSQELLRAQTKDLRKTKADGSVDLDNSLDYDSVLDRSGVIDQLLIDPATHQPRDPFLHTWIYAQINPAQAAYDYALGLLAKDIEANAEQRGEAKGKREVIDKIVKNAEKPRGIANLPSSSASQTGLTRAQIDRMSDDQKARLMREQPKVWDWYLGKG